MAPSEIQQLMAKGHLVVEERSGREGGGFYLRSLGACFVIYELLLISCARLSGSLRK